MARIALGVLSLATAAHAFTAPSPLPSLAVGSGHSSISCRSPPSGVSSISMAGFGKADSKAKKGSQAKTKIMGIPKKLLSDYGDLVKDGATGVRVFAGVKGGDDKWYECGSIASKGDKTPEACQLNKRLILEYACDLYPALKVKRNDLYVGYSSSGDKDDDVTELQKPASTEGVQTGFLPLQKGSKNAAGFFHIDGRVMPKSLAGLAAKDDGDKKEE
eukprot:CAMPEP_0174920758 /NCGR_PEP_ID=MMETSP1355-20121228/4661_1 /TAXON_ID=464990 /ORGANISM="Hemiselmis tepida, Strain CCMP443" /LENGTH=216 /DNA_ID=CAMNT_0016166153 /DNA_START=58 /DNA_END=708 /DNA_ORIENTATION=-